MMQTLLRKVITFSGIVGVVVLVGGVAIAMYRARLGFIDKRPLSYLGLYPSTHLLFSVSLIISAVLCIGFGFYVKNKFSLRNIFLGCFVFGQLCQIIVALVPDRSGSALKIVHTIAGFTLALSLPVLMRALAWSQAGAVHRRLYLVLYRLEQLAFVIGIGLFIFVRGIAPLGEALPNVGFDLWVIAVTLTTF